jgi:hypothetical protein
VKKKEGVLRESPKSYTTKIKSLVDNFGNNYTNSKTGNKHIFLEYINKDNIQPHSGVFFNVKYDKYDNFAHTPTEPKFNTQYKDIYNINTDDGLKNDGSNSNRIYDYNHHNDMKYNGPKRDDFSHKLNKDSSKEINNIHNPSDVHFKYNNNYIVITDDREKNQSSQKSTLIKTKLEKYYTKKEEYPSYSLSYKAKNLDKNLEKNLEKTLSKGTFSSTMQKLKK